MFRIAPPRWTHLAAAVLIALTLAGAAAAEGGAVVKRNLGLATLVALLLMVSGGARLAVSPAQAAAPVPLSFAIAQWGYDLQNPVEQQSPGFFQHTTPELWVYNRTGCVWDVDDDQVRYATNAYLDPGAWVVDEICLIADWAGQNWSGHLAGIWLISKSPDVLVTISFSPGWSFTLQPTWNSGSKSYDYKGCNGTPSYAQGDPALQPIPNSNGGVGVPTQVKLTVKNSGAHRATMDAEWKVGNFYTEASFC